MSDLNLRCETVSELATLYLEHALSAAQQVTYETHLVICDNCVAYLDDMRELVGRLHALPEDAVDDDERRRILDAAARR
jgi:predicted anti-sigma-YlaC factor YlaD